MGHQEELPQMRGLNSRSDFNQHPFTKQFLVAIHSLLVSCTREEFLSYFAQFDPRHREFLYSLFTLTVAQIRENAAAEFQSICEETRVLEVLDHVAEKGFLEGKSVCPEELVREVSVKKKLEEVNMMKQTLQKTRHDRDCLAAQLGELRAKMREASVDAVVDKITNVNFMLGSALE